MLVRSYQWLPRGLVKHRSQIWTQQINKSPRRAAGWPGWAAVSWSRWAGRGRAPSVSWRPPAAVAAGPSRGNQPRPRGSSSSRQRSCIALY